MAGDPEADGRRLWPRGEQHAGGQTHLQPGEASLHHRQRHLTARPQVSDWSWSTWSFCIVIQKIQTSSSFSSSFFFFYLIMLLPCPTILQKRNAKWVEASVNDFTTHLVLYFQLTLVDIVVDLVLLSCCLSLLPQGWDLLSDLQTALSEYVQEQPRPRLDPAVPLRRLLRPLREVCQSKKPQNHINPLRDRTVYDDTKALNTAIHPRPPDLSGLTQNHPLSVILCNRIILLWWDWVLF